MRVKIEATLPDYGWKRRLELIKEILGPGAYHGMKVLDCYGCQEYGFILCPSHGAEART